MVTVVRTRSRISTSTRIESTVVSPKSWIACHRDIAGTFRSDRTSRWRSIKPFWISQPSEAPPLLFEEAPLGAAERFSTDRGADGGDAFRSRSQMIRSWGSFAARKPARADRSGSLFPGSRSARGEKPACPDGGSTSLLYRSSKPSFPVTDGFVYTALLLDKLEQAEHAWLSGLLPASPFISFRWLKGAAEVYGRSPVMTGLAGYQDGQQSRRAGVEECVDRRHRHLAGGGRWRSEPCQHPARAGDHHSESRRLVRPHAATGTGTVRCVQPNARRPARPHSDMRFWWTASDRSAEDA